MPSGSRRMVIGSNMLFNLDRRRSGTALAERIGQNGVSLLTRIYHPDVPEWLRHLPVIDLLRRIWIQNFFVHEGGSPVKPPKASLPPAAASALLTTKKPNWAAKAD